LPSSRYVIPYLAPPVVIVPSGGLYRYGDSDEAAAWLETYVATGGTLLVLAQFDSADWEMLPGGQVRGLGYDQDILCRQASVHIVNSSPWIVGIGRDLPDIQIDGSFTQWPIDATVLLMRTTGNQMPAMIEYPYGLGTVVATAAYPDFYMNGLQSAEDIIFARGLFGAAYLQATGEALAANVGPNQVTSISVDITNTSAMTATNITLYRDFYTSSIGDSWRWAVHQPNPYGASQILTLNPPLLSGASRSVAVNFSAPQQAGLHRLAYFLGAQAFDFYHWNTAGAVLGPFYQVQSAAVKTDLFRFQLTPDQPAYDFGAVATLTATLLNNRSTARTFTLQPLSGLSAAPVVVTVGPHSTATRTFTATVDRTRQVRMAAVENGSTVSELLATLRLKLPTLGLSGAPENLLAGVAASGIYTAAVSNVPVGTTTVDWEVRQDGALLQSTSTPLAGTVGSSLAQLAVSLPATPPDVEFTVAAALPNTSRVMTQTIPVLKPVEIRSALLGRSPIIGDANDDALLVGLQDPGYPGQYNLQAQLKQGATVLSSGSPITGSLGTSFAVEALDLALPPTLTLGMTYTVALSITGQFAGAGNSYDDSYELPLVLVAPQTTLSNATRRAGQPLDVIVRSLPDTVALPAAGPFDLLLQGVSTYAYEPLSIESTTPLPNGAGVALHTHVPYYLYSGGLYDVQVTSPLLIGWQGHASLTVAPHRLEIEAPAAVAAGDVLTITLQNTGGVTATVSGNVLLADRRTATVAEMPFYLTVPANGSTPVALPVPAQLKSDPYILRLNGTDQLSQAFMRRRVVTVQGLQVELDSRTDEPAYLASDVITTTSTITPNAALSGATLRLRVLGTPPPAGPWDGWRARLADGGQSNSVSQTAAGPFLPGWNASPGTGVAPMAIDDLVIMLDPTCGNPHVTAVDSLDGSVRWQSEALPNYPYGLAANSQYVYVHTYPSCPSAPGEQPKAPLDPPSSELLAVDAATGAVVWQTSLATTGELLASDEVVAIQDFASDGFRLLDPATGITRTVLTTITDPLLVGDVLYDLDDDDQLAAYDGSTGNLLWSVAALPESELLAANASYVLTFQSYDPITFTTVNRLSVYASSGAHLGDVELSQAVYAPYFVLRGDSLFYLYVDTGGSTRSPEDIVSSVYKVDLNGLAETLFYTSEEQVSALAGSGDQLHMITAYTLQLISLDESGAVVDQSDISSLGGSLYDGLAVHQQGLLVLSYSGYEIHALLGSGPVSGGGGGSGRAVEATSVLREEWLPVDGSGVLSLPLPLTGPNLADDPRARGLLYLEGVLFAAEPASAQPAERQRLASSVYPFTIDNAVTSVTLHSVRSIYRRNVPGYTADDALAAVTLSGQVRNTGLNPTDIDLHIYRSDGALVLSQTFSSVAPNETRPFSVVDPAPPIGSVVYTATTTLGHDAVAEVDVRVGQVGATTAVEPASIVLGESASLIVDLANTGSVAGLVTVDLGDGPQDVLLAVGENASLSRVVTPTAPGGLSLPVTFSGDINRTDTPALSVQEETATASVVLTGTVRSLARAFNSLALVQGANAGLDFVLQNDGLTSFDAVVDYTLSGPEPLAGVAVGDAGVWRNHRSRGVRRVGRGRLHRRRDRSSRPVGDGDRGGYPELQRGQPDL
jgi:outer membrane protein assembly factor BamB